MLDRPAWLRLALPAALAMWLVPPAASALSLTIDPQYVSREDCRLRSSVELTMSWDLGSVTADHLELLASNTSGCADTSDGSSITTRILVDSLPTGQASYPASGDAAITIAEILQGAGMDPGSCDGSDSYAYLCVRAVTSSGSSAATPSARLTLQLERPPAPIDVVVQPGDQALFVDWTKGSTTTGATATAKGYRVYATHGGTTVTSGKVTATSLRLGGLVNDVSYDVQVVAYSEAGNASDASATATGTPQAVTDFWGAYQAAGGQEQGGCSGGSAGVFSLLLAALGRSRANVRGRSAVMTAGRNG